MKFLTFLLIAAIIFVGAIYLSDNAGSTPSINLPTQSSTPSYTSSSNSSSTSSTSSYTPPSNPITQKQTATQFQFYYEQLTDYQKQIYDSIIEPIARGEQKATVNSINISTIQKDFDDVCIAIQYDHPEYFWFGGGYYCEYPTLSFGSASSVTFYPSYYGYASGFFDYESKLNQLNREVERVARLAENHSSDDYERIIFVHDYLVDNTIYDHDALAEAHKTNHNPTADYIFAAYGCLINKDAVCAGYAKAFQMITQKLGFECIYVAGDAGGSHAWNCIKFDGEYYFVDATWDDIDLKKEEPVYNYAFITNSELSRTHKIIMPFTVPTCTASIYQYYKYNGYYANTYDISSTASILLRQSGKDAAHIQYGSHSEYQKALNDLITNGNLNNISGISYYPKYVNNDNYYTITFLK